MNSANSKLAATSLASRVILLRALNIATVQSIALTAGGGQVRYEILNRTPDAAGLFDRLVVSLLECQGDENFVIDGLGISSEQTTLAQMLVKVADTVSPDWSWADTTLPQRLKTSATERASELACQHAGRISILADALLQKGTLTGVDFVPLF